MKIKLTLLKNKTIAVVVPCYNEESQIEMVIETMPDFVDRIIIINDKSTDNTENVIKRLIETDDSQTFNIENILNNIKPNTHNRANVVLQEVQKNEIRYFVDHNVFNPKNNSRIILINHVKNSGKGSGISTGYKWAKDHGIDCTATMDGDGQMDPSELKSICMPVINKDVDYVKGNRLIHRSSLLVIPKIRFLGNSILSILTKLASGYWRISDTQTGYTAIGNKALNSIRIQNIFSGYGYPNDILVKLNIAFCKISEVEIKPVYDIGEKSKMKILKVIPTVSWLLIKSFFKRLWIKYLFRDFHPLFLLYHFALSLIVVDLKYVFKVLKAIYLNTNLSFETLFAFTFLTTFAFQSLLFAMWMDIQDNERLQK